jgi:hypothetical protein
VADGLDELRLIAMRARPGSAGHGISIIRPRELQFDGLRAGLAIRRDTNGGFIDRVVPVCPSDHASPMLWRAITLHAV